MTFRTVLSACAVLALTTGCAGFGVGQRAQSAAPKSIGVNSLLWQASLDTLEFMPLASADPFGGVIIYDWHVDPAVADERFRATVRILDTRLRADAVKVSLTREVNRDGTWTADRVQPETEAQLENQILSRARELRLAANTRR